LKVVKNWILVALETWVMLFYFDGNDIEGAVKSFEDLKPLKTIKEIFNLNKRMKVDLFVGE
jgi:hypothetical protein